MRRRFTQSSHSRTLKPRRQTTRKPLVLIGFGLTRRQLRYGTIGAGEGIRTLDPNLGKVVLYP